MYNSMHGQSEYQKFYYQTSARKATVGIDNKTGQEIFISLLFLLGYTAQIDTTPLLGSKTPLLIFSLLLGTIVSDFPSHVQT